MDYENLAALQTRTPRRGVGISLLALAACALAACSSGRATSARQHSAAIRPACAPPSITLNGSASTADLSAAIGAPTALSVNVADVAGSHLVSGKLVVARPGSTADSGNPSSLPPTSVELPANQIAQAPLAAGAATAPSSGLSFTPAASGVYPIMFVGTYVTTDDCTGTPPAAADAAHTFGFVDTLGTVTVP
jgi:hypothetical protein